MWPRRPANTKAKSQDARHAEAEKQNGEDELVVALAVDLEDGHVGDGGGDVKDEQHGADGVVDGGRGLATEGGCCWGVRRAGGRRLGKLVT